MIGLTVALSHAPNPDIAGGYWEQPLDSPRTMHALVNGLAQAQDAVQTYIARNGLGGGNWTGGELRLDGEPIGRICYNGRALDVCGADLRADDEALGVYAKAVART